MNIRQATLFDIPALVALNQGVQEMHAAAMPERFRRDAPAEEVAAAYRSRIQAPASFWLVAVDENDRPIAFLSAEFRDREQSWCIAAHRVCYLEGIAVAPAYRRQGIARALLSELRQEADLRGAAAMELDVWAFNEQARQVFAGLGFRTIMQRMALAR